MGLIAEVASAFVILRADGSGFGRSIDGAIGGDLESSGKRSGTRFGGAFKAGAVGIITAGVAVAGFLKGAIGEAREAQKVGALTNAVIKSTGGVANVTAGQVDKLATSISLKTGVDDEAIASGENMLLTFGNVRNEIGKNNDIFNQATVAASDMAAAFGGDAVSNSKLLGKALNDPVKGVSALTRVGVSFTQQQKDQIATLTASGDVLGAQKIILGEVTKQTGGAAEATATAGDKFKTAFANLQESVGTALLPLFDKLLTAASGFVIFLTNDIGPGIAALNGFLAPAIAGVGKFFSALGGGGSGGGASSLITTFQGIASSIQANFLPVLKTAADTFQNVVLPAVIAFASYVAANLLPIFVQVGQIIATQVVPIIATLAQFLYGTLYPAVVAIVTAIAQNLKPVFDALFVAISTQILPAISGLIAKFQEWLPTILMVVGVILKVVGVILIFAAAILGKVLPPLIRFVALLLGGLIGAIGTVIGWLVKIIGFVVRVGVAFVKAVIQVAKFYAGVVRLVGQVVKFIATLPGKAVSALSSLASKLVAVAVKAFTAMAHGVTSGVSKVINFVKELPGKAVSALSSLGSKIASVAVKAFNSFVDREKAGISNIISHLKEIPGKAIGAIGNLSGTLFNAGASLVQGFINGILSKIGDLISQINKLKGLLPGSPVKYGPLTSWNGSSQKAMRRIGGSLVGELAGGLGQTSALDASLMNLTRRINVPRVSLGALHGSSSVAGRAGGTPLMVVENMHVRDEHAVSREIQRGLGKAATLMATP